MAHSLTRTPSYGLSSAAMSESVLEAVAALEEEARHPTRSPSYGFPDLPMSDDCLEALEVMERGAFGKTEEGNGPGVGEEALHERELLERLGASVATELLCDYKPGQVFELDEILKSYPALRDLAR